MNTNTDKKRVELAVDYLRHEREKQARKRRVLAALGRHIKPASPDTLAPIS